MAQYESAPAQQKAPVLPGLTALREMMRETLNTLRGLQQSTKSPRKSKVRRRGGAESGALQMDEENSYSQLAFVGAAWPILPRETRAAITSLIHDSLQG
jgi:hypothetical protein